MSYPFPKDIIRLILLHVDLSTLGRVIRSFRLDLPDSWWHSYFFTHVPIKYEPLFLSLIGRLRGSSTLFVDRDYIKENGRFVLRKVKKEWTPFLQKLHPNGPPFLNQLVELNAIDLTQVDNILFTDGPIRGQLSYQSLRFHSKSDKSMVVTHERHVSNHGTGTGLGIYPVDSLIEMCGDLIITGGERSFPSKYRVDVFRITVSKVNGDSQHIVGL